MISNKLNNLIEKYKLTEIIKIVLLLIVLLLVFRIFIDSSEKIYEGFEQLGNGNIYGNAISLNDPTNMPIFENKNCTFILNNTYRIDTLVFKFNAAKTFTLSFTDGNGNIKNIKGSSSTGSPPTFTASSTPFLRTITNITDENNSPVYTSKIILSTTDTISDNILTSFGIYGGDRKLPTLTDYTDLTNTLVLNSSLTRQTPTTPSSTSAIDTYTFSNQNNSTDSMIYAIKLNLPLPNITSTTLTEMPFNIEITYENSIYYKNIFTVNTKYIVRNDYKVDDRNSAFIFLTEPIIANKITFSIPKINTKPTSSQFSLNITSISLLNKIPSPNNITDYKKTINLIQNAQNDTSNDTNICPSINEIVDTQTKTQQICDNMEYQDKVKSEKLRLERNKQYLLKLKDQQEQIDQLNNVIQELEDKRQARAQVSDQVRVLQYQKQKSDASTVRDLANQRLESQANNQLYVDVNFSNTQ